MILLPLLAVPPFVVFFCGKKTDSEASRKSPKKNPKILPPKPTASGGGLKVHDKVASSTSPNIKSEETPGAKDNKKAESSAKKDRSMESEKGYENLSKFMAMEQQKIKSTKTGKGVQLDLTQKSTKPGKKSDEKKKARTTEKTMRSFEERSKKRLDGIEEKADRELKNEMGDGTDAPSPK